MMLGQKVFVLIELILFFDIYLGRLIFSKLFVNLVI